MSPARKKSKSAKKAVKKTKTASAAPKSRSKSPVNPDAMSADVIEFITAIDDYKRLNQRPFPNWSEILEVVKALGYTREA